MADIDRLADDLNRYAASFAQPHEILGALAESDRWPSEQLSKNRAAAADFLDESGRHAEAELLKNPGRHVVVHGGSVHPARFTTDHVIHAYDRAVNHLDDWSRGLFSAPEWDYDLSGTAHNSEDFHEPPGPLPPHHVRVVHLDPNGYQPHAAHDTHLSQFGNHLADVLGQEVSIGDFGWNNGGEGADQLGWETGDNHTTPEDVEEHAAEHERLLKALREAPFEEIDTKHKT